VINMSQQAEKQAVASTISETDVARLIVETLHLDVLPSDLDPGAPLFGEGLGLDSIDMLEIALSVSKKYGFDLRSEDRAAFASVRALTAHIERHRTK
jgi:acyl carrier protein